jgi:periplasmic divalent cation tolerance protein
MTEYIQIFTTTASKEDAQKIARKLVEKRLAACAQVVGPISSTYRWKGKIAEEEEWLCMIKSRSSLYEELDRTIKGIHPYEEPEIVVLSIDGGSQGYLEWLKRETLAEPSR